MATFAKLSEELQPPVFLYVLVCQVNRDILSKQEHKTGTVKVVDGVPGPSVPCVPQATNYLISQYSVELLRRDMLVVFHILRRGQRPIEKGNVVLLGVEVVLSETLCVCIVEKACHSIETVMIRHGYLVNRFGFSFITQIID